MTMWSILLVLEMLVMMDLLYLRYRMIQNMKYPKMRKP
jgi:hypothetical protein